MPIPALIVLAAYLLGSVSGSLLLGRFRGVDIRQHGSGNAGGTNAFRTLGWTFALGVAAIDIGKGALAAWLALRFAPESHAMWLGYVAAGAAVLGHVWPLWHGFRGGKGAATVAGALLLLWPWTVPVLLAVWLLVLTTTGYVGLSTVVAATALPLFALATHADAPRMAFAVLLAAFIVFTHRENLKRLRTGTESRFQRVRVLHRLFARNA